MGFGNVGGVYDTGTGLFHAGDGGLVHWFLMGGGALFRGCPRHTAVNASWQVDEDDVQEGYKEKNASHIN